MEKETISDSLSGNQKLKQENQQLQHQITVLQRQFENAVKI